MILQLKTNKSTLSSVVKVGSKLKLLVLNFKMLKKGDKYSVQFGSVQNFNYDQTPLADDSSSKFEISNKGKGLFELTAKNNYDHGKFDITASVMPKEIVTEKQKNKHKLLL